MTRSSGMPAGGGRGGPGGSGRAWWRHPRHTPRRAAGLAAYESVLTSAGFSPVAGIDEAGRGACAGPLVVAAVALDSAAIRRLPGLADSKSLPADAREHLYEDVTRHAVDWHVLAIPAREVDAFGLHACNIAGMRRALAGLRCRPGYVLTDGFPVQGLGSPALAVWKGDQVTASVAAASVVAKVSRDRMMAELDTRYPAYGFARHKGYVTPDHMAALLAHGPCPEHRFSYANVIGVVRHRAAAGQRDGETAAGGPAGATGTDAARAGPAEAGPDRAEPHETDDEIEPYEAEPGGAGTGMHGTGRAGAVPARKFAGTAPAPGRRRMDPWPA